MDYVTRINLKTDCKDRQELINYCLDQDYQFLAIGWSCVYENDCVISNYEDYYNSVKSIVKRINPALNVFGETKHGDLFWTRDLDGVYWICRVIAGAESHLDKDKDIGAVIPVEAYRVGLEVPGRIKASFNRPRGGIVERIRDEAIVEYSKYIYNSKSCTETYKYVKKNGEIVDNLPEYDLEELVISYLQIEKNLYVLSNSIANKSTTIKIECELMSRDKNCPVRAVAQVKGGKTTEIDAEDYKSFVNDGYLVYLYAPIIRNLYFSDRIHEITREQIIQFYYENRDLLPDSITKWEDLFDVGKNS